MKKIFFILGITVVSLSSCGDENTEEKVVQKSTCECYKWGQDLQTKEMDALTKGSAEMKKAEDERKIWNEQCYDKVNPTVMSEKMKMLEDLENCK